MSETRLVILTAVALEARAMAGVWGSPTPKPGQPVRKYLAGVSVEIHLIGIRAVGLPTEFGDGPISAIVMAGLAGALDPTLEVGDVVLDDCPAEYVPDLPHRRGKIYCSPGLLATPNEKRLLFEKTQALAVDMESDPARALAVRLGVPFISVRAISDSAADTLDPAVMSIVNEFGQVRGLGLAATLLRRPGLIPKLKRLGDNANAAATNLAACVRSISQRWSQ